MIDPAEFYSYIMLKQSDDKAEKTLDFIYEEVKSHARAFLTWYTEDYFTDENFNDIYENWYKGK